MIVAAIDYLERGWSILPCRGKLPSIRTWTHLQIERPTAKDVGDWDRLGYLQNLGVICGAVSSNLIVIDLDGSAAVQQFGYLYPQLMLTRRVITARGQHVYLHVEKLPPTTKVLTPNANYELRSSGSYVLAPPSIHPETHKRYIPFSRRDVLHVPDVDDVVSWIASMQKRHERVAAAQPATYTANTSARETRYLDKALQGEVDKVKHASEGNRNSTLFWAAVRLANLFAAGMDRYKAESALLAAALAVGTPESEARRTIASGFNIGQKYPRHIPDRQVN
jgi:hypothetical protein